MRREYRTSCYGDFEADIRSTDSLPDRAEHGDGEVGFRLVHDSSLRVNRGGCWDLTAQSARVAYRYRYVPGYRLVFLGFRLVRDEEGK